MTLWAYMAVSLSESWDLVFAALDASAPTMWLVPAILLISLRTPAGSAFALLLIANAARMLAARRAPRLEAPPRGGPAGINRAAQPMFQCAGGQPIRNGTFLATAGAFGFQAGICAVCAERPLAAGGLFATGAILWTLAADKRTESELRAGPILRHLLLGVAATALLLAESRMEPLHGNASAARASGWLDEA